MTRARLTALLAGATLALALGASCGKSKPVGLDDGGADTGKPTGLAACLDTPDQLTRAPSATLPCELLPPGLAL